MRTRTLVLAAMLGLLVGTGVRADVTITYGSMKDLTITGDGTVGTITFNADDPDFVVNGVDGGSNPSAALGDVGRFFGTPGTFTFQNIVNIDAFTQKAALSSNDVKFEIADGNGGLLTGRITDSTITSFASGVASVVNTELTFNLSDVDYTGSEATYVEFENLVDAFAGGSRLTFVLGMNSKNLEQLRASGPVVSVAYSGNLVAVPEPGPLVLTALTTLPLMGFTYLRRRRNAA